MGVNKSPVECFLRIVCALGAINTISLLLYMVIQGPTGCYQNHIINRKIIMLIGNPGRDSMH
jgi:hypothetical protein